MDPETVKAYYNQSGVVAAYSQAANSIGLWVSEEKVFTRLFRQEDTLLELGCGTGRIAFGLWELGYHNILGVDVAREMIEEARRINRVLEYGLSFRVADATRLPFGDAEFDGAFFGFNGLMCIPGREYRRAALREILRVLRPGAWFAFTTHDRTNEKFRAFWTTEKKRWKKGQPPAPGLLEFGDRLVESPQGPLFIHIPERDEVLEDLAATGWRYEIDAPRVVLAQETESVRAFADDCIFWIAQKPPARGQSTTSEPFPDVRAKPTARTPTKSKS
jgi:ubiquinone/menaquinone biosynthesis C-methylase UbiE